MLFLKFKIFGNQQLSACCQSYQHKNKRIKREIPKACGSDLANCHFFKRNSAVYISLSICHHSPEKTKIQLNKLLLLPWDLGWRSRNFCFILFIIYSLDLLADLFNTGCYTYNNVLENDFKTTTAKSRHS